MSDERRLFGEIAVAKGYVTLDQVRKALEVQRDLVEGGKGRRLIGVILVELGYLTPDQVADILVTLDEEQRWFNRPSQRAGGGGGGG